MIVQTAPGRFPVKNKKMEKKEIILSDGTNVVLSIIRCVDGAINIDANIELTEEQADEIANMDL